MRRLINICESRNKIRLYHGTLAANIPSIKVAGLTTRVGEFVASFYDSDDTDEDDTEGLEELIFFADVSGLNKCVNAIAHLIWQMTGDRYDSFTEDKIREYGAIYEIEADTGWVEHFASDSQNYDDHPRQVEPGDYYSRYDVEVDRVLVGKDLIKFLVSHGYVFRPASESLVS